MGIFKIWDSARGVCVCERERDKELEKREDEKASRRFSIAQRRPRANTWGNAPGSILF